METTGNMKNSTSQSDVNTIDIDNEVFLKQQTSNAKVRDRNASNNLNAIIENALEKLGKYQDHALLKLLKNTTCMLVQIIC